MLADGRTVNRALPPASVMAVLTARQGPPRCGRDRRLIVCPAGLPEAAVTRRVAVNVTGAGYVPTGAALVRDRVDGATAANRTTSAPTEVPAAPALDSVTSTGWPDVAR